MDTVALDAFRDDYNWQSAFHEAINGCCGQYELSAVVDILASQEGENDERLWIAIGKWMDGKFFYLEAGCDYTGWDCQAGGTIEFFDSPSDVLCKMTLPDEFRERLGQQIRDLVGTDFHGHKVSIDW